MSNERSPDHVYTAPGTYTATLTVTGPGGTATHAVQDAIQVTED